MVSGAMSSQVDVPMKSRANGVGTGACYEEIGYESVIKF